MSYIGLISKYIHIAYIGNPEVTYINTNFLVNGDIGGDGEGDDL